MPEQWFLKVDGIAGESTAARHAKEIDVESWSFGASAAAAPHVGAGAGSGRVSLEPFAFEARLSAATPLLFRACVTGLHIPTATLTGVRAGVAGFDFATYALSDVVVTSARHGDTQGGLPFDRFTLGCTKLTITFRPQLPTGAAGPPVTVTYPA